MSALVSPSCARPAAPPPSRRSWSVPLQLAAAAQVAYFNASLCSAASLSAPRAQALTHRMFALVDAAHFELVPAPLPTLPPAVECQTLLLFQQLALGLAAPLVLQAVLEARLHEEHQEEREAAGLRRERGLQASFSRRWRAWRTRATPPASWRRAGCWRASCGTARWRWRAAPAAAAAPELPASRVRLRPAPRLCLPCYMGPCLQ